MRILCCFLLLANSFFARSQQLYQLAPPVLQYSSVFFTKEANLAMLFNQPDAEIRYTTDGAEPAKNSLLYSGPIRISGDAVTVKAKSFGEGFLPSETVSASFVKTGIPIKKITTTAPNPKYAGNGEKTLHDGLGGVLNSSAKTWLGFNNDTVTIDIELPATTAVTKIKMHVLEQQSAWIFKPLQVRLYAMREGREMYETLCRLEYKTTAQEGANYTTIEMPAGAEKTLTNQLRLVILPVKNIPDWHDGKGQHGWFFIDEINVYGE